MKRIISLIEIIILLGNDIQAIYGCPEGQKIHHLKDAANVDEFTLDWVNPLKDNGQRIAENSKARALIVTKNIEYSKSIEDQNKVLLFVENPTLAIAKVGNKFFAKRYTSGIHPTAVIDPETKIGDNIYIGPNCIIEKCTIGNNVQLHGNCYIYENSEIGNNVEISVNVVVGSSGLGCIRNSNNELICFPHLGSVIIQDNVTINSNCIIARGALSNTIIGKGSKINSNCHIAHNVSIGRNVWISPKVNIAGSVKILDNATIFSGAIIREQLTIGEESVIGMGSVVTKNVPTNETWIGVPAKVLKRNN